MSEISTRISSSMERTEATRGTVMPKSANFHDGSAVAVAVSFAPSRFAVTVKLTSFVLPCTVIFPAMVNLNSPDNASGSVAPVAFSGTNSAVGKRRVSRVLSLMKPSRWLWSLRRVVRSVVILEPAANVPSVLSVNVPFIPVAVRTASPGARICASTSRTRTVVFDDESTVKVHGPAAEMVPAGCALPLDAGVVLGVVGAASEHALSASANRTLAARSITDLDHSRHLRMHAAVVCERPHLIEGEGDRLAGVDADVERPSRIVGRDGVELLALIHDRDGRPFRDLERARAVGPFVLLALWLDHVDGVRLEAARRLTRRAGARDREERRARDDAEGPAWGHRPYYARRGAMDYVLSRNAGAPGLPGAPDLSRVSARACPRARRGSSHSRR